MHVSSSQLLDARRCIAIQYAARLPPQHPAFIWPTEPSALLAVQSHLDSDLFQQDDKRIRGNFAAAATSRIAPASTSYGRRFLKVLIEKLQDAISRSEDPEGDLEIDDSLMERYVSFLAVPDVPSAPPPTSKLQFFYPSPLSSLNTAALDNTDNRRDDAHILFDLNSILLEESGTMISSGTTGLRTWEASLQMANHIVSSSHPSSSPLTIETIVRPGVRLLELGSGVGMLGVLCAQLQQDARQTNPASAAHFKSTVQARTALTDVPGPVLETIEGTLGQNNLASSEHVRVVALDWIELSNEAETGLIHTWLRALAPNVILAADVVFDPDLCRPLARTVRASLEAGVRQDWPQDELPVAFIASTIRNTATYATFKAALEEAQLDFRPIELQSERLTLPTSSGVPPAKIFPSTHDPQRDGHVELLEIRCRPEAAGP